MARDGSVSEKKIPSPSRPLRRDPRMPCRTRSRAFPSGPERSTTTSRKPSGASYRARRSLHEASRTKIWGVGDAVPVGEEICGEKRAARDVPETEVVVYAASGDEASVGGERDGGYRSIMSP